MKPVRQCQAPDTFGGHLGLGYARVSTTEQNHDLQTDTLQRAGCGRVWVDHGVSGTKAPLSRPEFADLWKHLREGDVLVIYRLDRLARNARAALEIVEGLDERGVALRSLNDGISTEGGGTARLILTVMAAVAELEVAILRESTRDGLEAARSRGTKLGRREALTDEQKAHARTLRADGKPLREIARLLGVGKTTIAKVVELL
ncbi:recombinase family protein [Microbacterium sp. AGC62]